MKESNRDKRETEETDMIENTQGEEGKNYEIGTDTLLKYE